MIEQEIKDLELELSNLNQEKEILDNKINTVKKDLSRKMALLNGGKLNDLIDKMFETVAPETNTILIAQCEGERADECIGHARGDCFGEWPYYYFHIDKYNKWCNTEKDISDKTINLLDEVVAAIKEIDKDNTILPFIEDIYEGCSSINEYWAGFIAITRDHELVNFICRYDNMMLNNYEDLPTLMYDLRILRR